MRNVDVCVIGAGPAGMKAATNCSQNGASVVLLDEQSTAGGQIYRSIKENGHPLEQVLGPDYLQGSRLVKDLNQQIRRQSAPLVYINEATIWRVDADKQVYWSRRGVSESLQARHIIIATGAIERSFPFPGWTLPGVMPAGAGQILLKTAGVVPQNAVMVGTGPLLYLLAAQLIDAGTPPLALVDTLHPRSYLKAVPYTGKALLGYRYLLKGMKLLRKIKQAGVHHYTQATDIIASGETEVERLSFKTKGQSVSLETPAVLAHIGVIPDVQLTRSLGAAHQWDTLQQCWKPQLDDHYRTSVTGISVAGDGGGIGGALVAECQGELVALDVLHTAGLIQTGEWEQRHQDLRYKIRKEMAVRPFLDVLYTPPSQAFSPADQTIVCRCEEVTAGEIRQLAKQGCQGINQIKTLTRCGMGPCQGRYCGATVAAIISTELHQTPEQVGYYRIRHPIKPLKLGELASFTRVDQSFMTQYRKQYSNKGDANDSNSTSVYDAKDESHCDS